jgi:hypothetical protein
VVSRGGGAMRQTSRLACDALLLPGLTKRANAARDRAEGPIRRSTLPKG